LLQSAAHPLRHRIHHPTAGRGEIRVTRCPLFRGKVMLPSPPGKRSHLDRLYQRVSTDLDQLVYAVGLNFSFPFNENKIPVEAPITAYAFSQTGLRKSGPRGAV